MGRTVPTFTNLIDAELSSWTKFRRGLRKEDQEVFDEIFRAAKLHLAENFYAMRAVPFESMMMSILIEQQKAVRRLENEISGNGGCAFRQKDGGQAGAEKLRA
jgi:hypothetical protein